MENSASIASHVQHCFDAFHNTCTSLAEANISIKRKLLPWNLNDQLGRFRLWCSNVAAHQSGRSSLDYKLREASHLRDRVIELLQNLETVIQEAYNIISGETVPWEDLANSDSEYSDEEGPSHGDDQNATTELQQLCSNVAEITTCLMRLSMAIRNPAPHDQFKESTRIDTSHFESFDIEHVRGKFPQTEEYLVVRLGKAISRRRQYLRYRDEHQKKLKHGLDAAPVEVRTVPEDIESTVASSIPLAMKDPTFALHLDNHDSYEDVLSQTTCATSANNATKLRPPPVPLQGQGGSPFECPLCFRLTVVRQTAAWHKHVYRDLHPYVCSFKDCPVPDCIYESRRDWFGHELQAHRLWWECIDPCNLAFESQIQFRDHLLKEHTDWTSDARVDDLIRSCQRQVYINTQTSCPLCQKSIATLKELGRHLGKHYEELALFALPLNMNDDLDGSNNEQGNDEFRSLSSSVSVHTSSSCSTEVPTTAMLYQSNPKSDLPEEIDQEIRSLQVLLGNLDPDAVSFETDKAYYENTIEDLVQCRESQRSQVESMLETLNIGDEAESSSETPGEQNVGRVVDRSVEENKRTKELDSGVGSLEAPFSSYKLDAIKVKGDDEELERLIAETEAEGKVREQEEEEREKAYTEKQRKIAKEAALKEAERIKAELEARETKESTVDKEEREALFASLKKNTLFEPHAALDFGLETIRPGQVHPLEYVATQTSPIIPQELEENVQSSQFFQNAIGFKPDVDSPLVTSPLDPIQHKLDVMAQLEPPLTQAPGIGDKESLESQRKTNEMKFTTTTDRTGREDVSKSRTYHKKHIDDLKWYCGNCGDGPNGIWMPSCSACSHKRCDCCTDEW